MFIENQSTNPQTIVKYLKLMVDPFSYRFFAHLGIVTLPGRLVKDFIYSTYIWVDPINPTEKFYPFMFWWCAFGGMEIQELRF